MKDRKVYEELVCKCQYVLPESKCTIDRAIDKGDPVAVAIEFLEILEDLDAAQNIMFAKMIKDLNNAKI